MARPQTTAKNAPLSMLVGPSLPRELHALLPAQPSPPSATSPRRRLLTPRPSSTMRFPRLARQQLLKPLPSSAIALPLRLSTPPCCCLHPPRACSTTARLRPAMLCRLETANACAAAAPQAVLPLPRECTDPHLP